MELRDLDLNLLLVLDAVFEEGTLTRTAQRLRLSQPTVSASLAKLRGILGDELFVRTNGRMQPTARALALRGAVALVLKTVRLEILSQAGFDPDNETGAFTVSLSDIGELEFLPRLLSRLARDAPHAAVKSVVATPVELSTAMDVGEIDLAIGYFPDLTTSVFKQQLLFQHSSACVVRHDHPTIGPVMTLDDYLSAKHVVISQKGRIQDVVEVGLAAKGLHRRIGVQIAHFVSIPFIVAGSDLVATIPRPLAIQFAAICDLRVLDPPFPIPTIEIKQLWHRRFDGHPRLKWLRNVVAEMCQNRPVMGVR
jgi:DNA-binding transcriptional LysR family regulator